MAVTSLVVALSLSSAIVAEVDFNRDIRPILANHCLPCHGPDASQRKAKLRLDLRDEAVRGGLSGPAILPGKPDESELLARVNSVDPEEMMPPPGFQKPLSAAQKSLLQHWIREGAAYSPHWAFVRPRRPELPQVRDREWARNPIDRFILARLESEGMPRSAEASRPTLIRRLSLDLRGLPPTREEVSTFLADQSPEAYERLVDRILDSPHYGERMAVDWLDAARFADTNGYQVDRDREMYAWRDWVIRAFNENMPFDQFTIEQLAGDLLPHPGLSQKVATGFHRNHMMNEEGGIIPEEFLAEYTADRVETTAAVWLGQTFQCARCHDHKYDPFSQRDFYALKAFFHNVSEKGIGDYGADIRRNNPPMLRLPAPEIEARLAKLDRELAELEQELRSTVRRLDSSQAVWEADVLRAGRDWSDLKPTSAQIEIPTPADEKSARPAGPSSPTIRAVLAIEGAKTRGIRVEFPADRLPAKLEAKEVSITSRGGGARPAVVAIVDSIPKDPASGRVARVLVLDQTLHAGPVEVRLPTTARGAKPEDFRWARTEARREDIGTKRILEILSKPASARTKPELDEVARAFRELDRSFVSGNERLAALRKERDRTDLEIPTTLVMEELPVPRPTFILMRGAYDRPGAQVTAATPASLPPMAPGLPKNRLGLARWLVEPSNPLTARVIVNRFWQSIFGTGLVRTAEDFGTQGELPSHPELLDWLATDFARSGWDVKRLVRLMVTSATYRQTSDGSPDSFARDPENRLLSRGVRFRLQAEFLRDQALALGGLLVPKIGGPSVRPYHPPGLYEQVVAGKGPATYTAGKGEDLYRRSLYTYWKRSVPHPSMLVFDAPFRESCTLRRTRTNTPLQALNLLNDPTYVEAARAIAGRVLNSCRSERSEDLVADLVRLVLAREPRASERTILVRSLDRARLEFERSPADATALLSVGESRVDPKGDPARLAALTTLASLLLNLDETVHKE